MIEFNKPPFIGTELELHPPGGRGKQQAVRRRSFYEEMFCLDAGQFQRKTCDAYDILHPCTGNAAYLSEIRPGDEVIMPSYTFVSTADAFVLRGAKIVYVDIRPDTMNIDETKIEDAITEKQSDCSGSLCGRCL